MLFLQIWKIQMVEIRLKLLMLIRPKISLIQIFTSLDEMGNIIYSIGRYFYKKTVSIMIQFFLFLRLYFFVPEPAFLTSIEEFFISELVLGIKWK